jgi:hypothetical protein
MLALRVIAPAEVCRRESHSCLACCCGPDVSRESLTRKLRRQTRLFRSLPTGAGVLRLMLFELLARRGLCLLLGPLFLVPWLGVRLRRRLGRHEACAFLGFEGDSETRVGCMIHPSQRPGKDVRRRVAFALLPGYACGRPGYYCHAARAGQIPDVPSNDWFAYSRAIANATSP